MNEWFINSKGIKIIFWILTDNFYLEFILSVWFFSAPCTSYSAQY